MESWQIRVSHDGLETGLDVIGYVAAFANVILIICIIVSIFLMVVFGSCLSEVFGVVQVFTESLMCEVQILYV
jgi:hypothetical protein